MMGRKKAIILYGLPLTAGWILICTSRCFAQLIIGRVLTGFSAGLMSGTAPTYVSEISTTSIRGMLGSMAQVNFLILLLH
jgi:MFS family permease